MKKIFVVLILFSFLVGCESLNNTPTKRVEELLNKYQTLDKKLLKDLDIVMEENDYTEEQKEKYKDIMKKQYKDLVYVVKEEEINGDIATVKVEIEVYDYSNAIIEANNFFMLNQNTFLDQNGQVDKTKYVDYKINLMKDMKERVKYTIEFVVRKKDDKWVLDDISDMDREKIHGIYTY